MQDWLRLLKTLIFKQTPFTAPVVAEGNLDPRCKILDVFFPDPRLCFHFQICLPDTAHKLKQWEERGEVCEKLLGVSAMGASCPSSTGISGGGSEAEAPVPSVCSVCSDCWLHPGRGRLRICEARVPVISPASKIYS